MYKINKRFPFIRQLDQMDCGPTCLQMIIKHYGRNVDIDFLRKACYVNVTGTSLMGIASAAEQIGMKSIGTNTTYDTLLKYALLPFIAYWGQEHFVVVYKMEKDKVWLADPAHGKITYSREDFIKSWASTVKNGEAVGVCLLLEPTPDFYSYKDEPIDKKGFSFLFR